jgi:hypothetical protein
MKQLFLFIIILCSLNGISQKQKNTKTNEYSTDKNYGISFNTQYSDIIGEYKQGNDTFYIYPNDKIHYIKIGEKVYKITSPELKEVFVLKKYNSYWDLGDTSYINLSDTLKLTDRKHFILSGKKKQK